MRFIDRLAYLLSTVSSILLILAMAGMVTADVVIRAATGRGLPWALDLTSIFLVAFFFAILPWSLRSDAHVRMDIFYLRMGPRMRRLANLVGIIGAAIFFGAVGLRAFEEAPRMAAFGIASPTVQIPYWPSVTFVGICAVLSIAALLSALVSLFRDGD